AMQGSSQVHQNGFRSEVMQEYLYTMERFLNLQQEVMQVFMNGARAVSSSTANFEETNVRRFELEDNQQRTGTAPHNPMHTPASSAAMSGLTSHQSEAVPSADDTVALVQREGEDLPLTVDGNGLSPDAIGQTLLKLISERTGYPTDMLDLTLN